MKKLLLSVVFGALLLGTQVAQAAGYQFTSFLNGTNLTMISSTNSAINIINYNTLISGTTITNYVLYWFDGTLLAQGNTNGVGTYMGYWERDVPLTSLSTSEVNTNIAFYVSGYGNAATVTNTVVFSITRSADGTNFDTVGSATTVTLTANGTNRVTQAATFTPSFLTGMSKLRVNVITVQTNVGAASSFILETCGIGRFVP